MADKSPDTGREGADDAPREASLLSIDIAPRRRDPGVPTEPGPALLEAWLRAGGREVATPKADRVRAEMEHAWPHCFWVAYEPMRDRFEVTPNGPMPGDIAARLEGADDFGRLVGWINHIATRNCHSREPMVSTGRLDLEAGLTDLELTLVPMDRQGSIVSRFLGALGL